MNVKQINDHLLRGELDAPGLFPHLENLRASPVVFDFHFGLEQLPTEPGLIIIRGARQFGKSTWLEQALRETIQEYGPGHGLYLNGDEIPDAASLTDAVRNLIPLFGKRRPARLFIDEITAVQNWQKAIKRLIDSGELREVLLVNTGSKALDLRRGGERLPGRKGRLDRTDYIFLPITFSEFKRKCRQKGLLEGSTDAYLLDAYRLTGGCPLACAEIAQNGRLPEFIIGTVRDWILGEVARAGRSRASLLTIMERLHRLGASPVGQARLARETGLANNTVAAGYIELLADLMSVGIQKAWDPSRRIKVARRPAKYPFINLLAAIGWSPERIRTVSEYRALPLSTHGRWTEWLVAQEIWRREAFGGNPEPEQLCYWRSKQHELDFVVRCDLFVEVKAGKASPMGFSWFPTRFPKAQLLVVNQVPFQAGPIQGITLQQFMEDEDPLRGLQAR